MEGRRAWILAQHRHTLPCLALCVYSLHRLRTGGRQVNKQAGGNDCRHPCWAHVQAVWDLKTSLHRTPHNTMSVVEIEAGENMCLTPAAPLRHTHMPGLVFGSVSKTTDHHGYVDSQVVTKNLLSLVNIVVLPANTRPFPSCQSCGDYMTCARRPCNPIRRSRPPVDIRPCGLPVLGGSTQGSKRKAAKTVFHLASATTWNRNVSEPSKLQDEPKDIARQ